MEKVLKPLGLGNFVCFLAHLNSVHGELFYYPPPPPPPCAGVHVSVEPYKC